MDCDPQLTARARERRVPPRVFCFFFGRRVVGVGWGVGVGTARQPPPALARPRRLAFTAPAGAEGFSFAL